jgi:SOS-response transcriptional repressor LexA
LKLNLMKHPRESTKSVIFGSTMSDTGTELDERIRKNLKALMVKRGLIQREVAQLAGMKPQVLNSYIKRKRAFGRTAIERLAHGLNVSEAYLIGGETTVAIDAFQEVIDRYTFEARTPLVSLEGAAEWDEFTDVTREGYAITWLPFKLRGKNDIAIKVPDDSMEPEFKVDEVVILGRYTGELSGKFVLARVDKEVLFRKYREFQHGVVLVPLN